MNTWYELTPADTLFFRGSEPLEAGQLSRAALFPPPVTVLQGAIRTAVLKRHGVSFADYNAGRCPAEVAALVGPSGQPAPFRVTAVLLGREGILYAPCPASWFTEATSASGSDAAVAARTVLRAAPPADSAKTLRLQSSAGNVLPMVRANDAQPLAGHWLRMERLRKPAATVAATDLLAPEELYDVEPRTGIAMDGRRKVVQGRLYSAGHIRLRAGVRLVVALDRDPGLMETGLLALGGEKRVCGYSRIEAPPVPDQPSPLFMTLAPVELTPEVLPCLFAAAKPVALAGWDLATGFHKPTTTWLPAGAVFTQNINNHCVPLAQ